MQINTIKKWHKIAFLFAICDFLGIGLAYFLGLWLRFDCEFSEIPEKYLHVFRTSVSFQALAAIAIYAMAQLYNRVWRFVGYRELIRCIVAGVVSVILYYLVLSHLVSETALFNIRGRMPFSYFVFGGLFQMTLLVGSRFVWRMLWLLFRRATSSKVGKIEFAMLIGGGSAGQLILRDLSTTVRRNIVFKCIVDDDPNKWGCFIEDVRVIGGREKILDAVRKYAISKIFIAIPTASAEQRREILDICKESGCEVKLLPGLYQFTDDEVTLANMRNVSVDDLLGRDPIKVDENGIDKLLRGRVVLVTGAAGSIGSELCRLIAKNSPARLVALDINENGMFYLMQELLKAFPDVKMDFLMGSMRDYARIEEIFDKYSPEIVFHAAGHKHLTMMEASPLEAVKNNIAGTYNVSYAALTHGCRKFILLSTDKAVNPVSILGASSRVCEILMQLMESLAKSGRTDTLKPPMGARSTAAKRINTEFASIRFGTVMGSEGSIFQ
ncbi:MAG: polysaccharide biosynthesis protein, partial [Victivallales bacterium]|nr:polysaccharide biosynthesis protein [Victivallales bacterium]